MRGFLQMVLAVALCSTGVRAGEWTTGAGTCLIRPMAGLMGDLGLRLDAIIEGDDAGNGFAFSVVPAPGLLLDYDGTSIPLLRDGASVIVGGFALQTASGGLTLTNLTLRPAPNLKFPPVSCSDSP